jgi:hypothetical protein
MALPIMPRRGRSRRATRQRENGPVQSVGVTGDVDPAYPAIGSDGNPQQRLWPPVGRHHDARNTVDKHHHAGPCPLGESTGLLGDFR